MTVEGVDYSWSRPSPFGLATAGKRFACRYLSYDPSKNLTRAEQQALAAVGIAVVCNWEHTASGARGRAAGHAQATEALRLARELGMPEDRPIYFSVDWDATPTDLGGEVGDYFRGVASVIGVERVGVYGGYRTIAAAVSGRWARWLWQTYAWSGGRWHPSAHVQQYHNGVLVAGGDVDLDRAMVDDYGQWGVDMTSLDDKVKCADGVERSYAGMIEVMFNMTFSGASYPKAGGPATPVPGARAWLVTELKAIAAAESAPVTVSLSDTQLDELLDKLAARLAQ